MIRIKRVKFQSIKSYMNGKKKFKILTILRDYIKVYYEGAGFT